MPSGGEHVRIEQYAGSRVPPVLHVQNALILQAGVLEVEVAPSILERGRKAGVVPDLRQSVLDRRAFRDRCQKRIGQPVFCFHPCLGRRRIGVLEPAVGIGDADAMVVVDLGAARGGRVAEWGVLRLGTQGAGDDRERRENGAETVTTHGLWPAVLMVMMYCNLRRAAG